MQGLVCHKSTKYSEHNLPFTVIQYKLNSAYIDFVPSQVDLVSVNTKLNWKEQCDKLVGEANSRLGLLRYTCHFTIDKKQKITFYLAIARYIFVYCSIIWQHTISYQISLKFDAVQKKLNGLFLDNVLNIQKELNILPIWMKFYLNRSFTFLQNNIIICFY